MTKFNAFVPNFPHPIPLILFFFQSSLDPPNLSNFNPTTFSEIRNLIFSSQNKQCELDSIPTFLFKLCFDELGPTVINIINLSLSECIFPSSFKQAIVHPLLKKPSLPDDDLNNFRPISNLNFISKITEKVVASRIKSHLLSNSLSSSFQSAYRMFHSTETTLLGMHNDLTLAMDRGEVTFLILLDLSAAFDTVDHSIILHRLQHWFGLHGTSLDWLSSYLTSRSQAVSVQNKVHHKENISRISWYSDWLHNTTSAGNSIFVTNHNTTFCGRSIMQPIRLP